MKRFIRRHYNIIKHFIQFSLVICGIWNTIGLAHALISKDYGACATYGFGAGIMFDQFLVWIYRPNNHRGPDQDNDDNAPDDKGPDGGISKMIRHQINEILKEQEVK